MTIKKLNVAPFPCQIMLYSSAKTYKEAHLSLFGFPVEISGDGRADGIGTYFIVYAGTQTALAHEFAHVLFSLLDTVGIDPRDSQGEVFCYALGKLLRDAKVWEYPRT